MDEEDQEPAAIGLDIGSFKTIVAKVKDNAINIVPGPNKEDSTQTIISYPRSDDRVPRKIGNDAANQIENNLKMTYPLFTRYLGLRINHIEQVNLEKWFINYDLDQDLCFKADIKDDP